MLKKDFLNFECQIDCPYRSTCCQVPTEVIRHGNNTNIDILIFGMGAGKDEEKLRRCFVGKAGKYMRSIIKYMWDTTGEFNVALSNNVRFHPIDLHGKDRQPTPEEISRCFEHLKNDIITLMPKVIVPVGRNATSTFAPIGNTPMSNLRGHQSIHSIIKSISNNNIISSEAIYMFKYVPTWHPSYLARQYGTYNSKANNFHDRQFISDILLALEISNS